MSMMTASYKDMTITYTPYKATVTYRHAMGMHWIAVVEDEKTLLEIRVPNKDLGEAAARALQAAFDALPGQLDI